MNYPKIKHKKIGIFGYIFVLMQAIIFQFSAIGSLIIFYMKVIVLIALLAVAFSQFDIGSLGETIKSEVTKAEKTIQNFAKEKVQTIQKAINGQQQQKSVVKPSIEVSVEQKPENLPAQKSETLPESKEKQVKVELLVKGAPVQVSATPETKQKQIEKVQSESESSDDIQLKQRKHEKKQMKHRQNKHNGGKKDKKDVHKDNKKRHEKRYKQKHEFTEQEKEIMRKQRQEKIQKKAERLEKHRKEMAQKDHTQKQNYHKTKKQRNHYKPQNILVNDKPLIKDNQKTQEDKVQIESLLLQNVKLTTNLKLEIP